MPMAQFIKGKKILEVMSSEVQDHCRDDNSIWALKRRITPFGVMYEK